MFIDMHVHSKSSDDAGGTVEGYLKWVNVLRKKGFALDGIVFTEHRGFDFDEDYSALSEQYGVVVLKGSEIETNLGHMLIYGVNKKLTDQLDFTNITLPAHDVLAAVKECGAYAIAAHPGRPRIGLWQHVQAGATIDDIQTVEVLNGGSNSEENSLASTLAEEYKLFCSGGSDSHYVSTVGRCATSFNANISRIEELIEQLHLGNFGPVRLDDTKSA